MKLRYSKFEVQLKIQTVTRTVDMSQLVVDRRTGVDIGVVSAVDY